MRTRVTLYTDASFKDGVAGLHAYIRWDEGRVEKSWSRKCVGSNQAEILAAQLGIKAAQTLVHDPDIIVCTDNAATVKWAKLQGHRAKKIKAHRNNWMNNRCDERAGEVRKQHAK